MTYPIRIFGLVGLVVSLAFSPLMTGCGSVSERAKAAGMLTGDPVDGQAIYMAECAVCHGQDGTGTEIGPNLLQRSSDPADEIIQVMLDGPDSMPSYSGREDQELADVAAHVASL